MSAVPEPSTNWSNTGRRTARAFSKDLESRLDWIAVDHRNTGHAHTHIIVRGVLDDGRILILNIAGDYIAHGIRHRASELVTLELDHQGEIELQTKAEERGRSRAMDPARQDVADRAAGAGDYRLRARGGSDLSCPREPRPHDRPGQAPGTLRSSQRGRAATVGRFRPR